MLDDLKAIGGWLVGCFTTLWSSFGALGFIGFAVVCLPILRKLIRLFRGLINTN